jgi:hypothetical protein
MYIYIAEYAPLKQLILTYPRTRHPAAVVRMDRSSVKTKNVITYHRNDDAMEKRFNFSDRRDLCPMIKYNRS